MTVTAPKNALTRWATARLSARDNRLLSQLVAAIEIGNRLGFRLPGEQALRFAYVQNHSSMVRLAVRLLEQEGRA